jgi:hypothetical protein
MVIRGLTILKNNIGQEAAMDVNELTDQERAILG